MDEVIADSVSLSPNLISWAFRDSVRPTKNTRSENRDEANTTYADGDGVIFVYNRHDAHR